MTATFTPSAAPPWAITCWVDNHTLYFELRGAAGPQVIAFARHDLSKALAILFANYHDTAAGMPYLRPAVVAKELSKEGLTQEDLDKARAVLMEMGLLK